MKKTISVLLVLALLCCLVPAAFAAESSETAAAEKLYDMRRRSWQAKAKHRCILPETARRSDLLQWRTYPSPTAEGPWKN